MPTQDFKPDTRRIAFFSDVFLAAVLVIMAADLRGGLPAEPTDLEAWAPTVAPLLAFILGFFTLAVVWVNHSFLTGALEQVSRGIMWLNLHVMFWISLFPVAVRLLGRSETLEAGAVAYGVVLTGLSTALFILRTFARAKSRSNRAMAALAEVSTYRSFAATLICAGAIPVALLSPYVSIVCFVAAPALFLLPEPRADAARPLPPEPAP